MPIVDLTDEEIVLLDGKCGEKAQAEVNAAKLRLAAVAAFVGLDAKYAGFIADAVSLAKTDGRLGVRWEYGTWCRLCKRSAGYAKYKQSGRYHKKGDENRKKPLTMPLIDLRVSFVTIKGHVSMGCCDQCWAIIKPELKKALASVQAQMPESLTGEPPKWRRFDNRQCRRCGWKGHEGQMMRLPTLMGDGHYFGGCPNCDAENVFLGRPLIEAAEGFTIEPTQS